MIFKFYFDIADIGFLRSEKKASETDLEDDWSFLLKKRNIFCPVEKSFNNSNLKTCINTRGKDQYNKFFTEGVSLSDSDVDEGNYKSLGVFIRRMVTSPATIYNASNNPVEINSDNLPTFDNETVQGINILPYYSYSPQDNTSTTDPRILPLLARNLDINIDSGKHPYVLEVRIFLKNLFMKHIIVDPNLNTNRSTTLIGPSDWLIDHGYNNTTNPNNQSPRIQERLGGGILMTARTYFPHNAATLQIKAGTPCMAVNTGLSYIAVLPAGKAYNINTLPLASTRFSSSSETINNLPAGNYDVYKTYDKTIKTDTGNETGKDGFPESFTHCQSNIILTNSTATSIDISSCSCP